MPLFLEMVAAAIVGIFLDRLYTKQREKNGSSN